MTCCERGPCACTCTCNCILHVMRRAGGSRGGAPTRRRRREQGAALCLIFRRDGRLVSLWIRSVCAYRSAPECGHRQGTHTAEYYPAEHTAELGHRSAIEKFVPTPTANSAWVVLGCALWWSALCPGRSAHSLPGRCRRASLPGRRCRRPPRPTCRSSTMATPSCRSGPQCESSLTISRRSSL